MFAFHPIVFGYRTRLTVEARAVTVSAALRAADRAPPRRADRDLAPAAAQRNEAPDAGAYTCGLLTK